MAFKLHSADGYENFQDEDRYWFDKDHGHLITLRGNGEKKTYSPSAWTFVEEYRDPEASIAGGFV